MASGNATLNASVAYDIPTGDAVTTGVAMMGAAVFLSFVVLMAVHRRATLVAARLPGYLCVQCIAAAAWLLALIPANDLIPVRVLWPPGPQRSPDGMRTVCFMMHYVIPWALCETVWVAAVIARLGRVHSIGARFGAGSRIVGLAAFVLVLPAAIVPGMYIASGSVMDVDWAAYTDAADPEYGTPICRMHAGARYLTMVHYCVQLAALVYTVRTVTVPHPHLHRPRAVAWATAFLFALLVIAAAAIGQWDAHADPDTARHAYTALCITFTMAVLAGTLFMFFAQAGDMLLLLGAAHARRCCGQHSAYAQIMQSGGSTTAGVLELRALLRRGQSSTLTFSAFMSSTAARVTFTAWLARTAPKTASLWQLLGGCDSAQPLPRDPTYVTRCFEISVDGLAAANAPARALLAMLRGWYFNASLGGTHTFVLPYALGSEYEAIYSSIDARTPPLAGTGALWSVPEANIATFLSNAHGEMRMTARHTMHARSIARRMAGHHELTVGYVVPQAGPGDGRGAAAPADADAGVDVDADPDSDAAVDGASPSVGAPMCTVPFAATVQFIFNLAAEDEGQGDVTVVDFRVAHLRVEATSAWECTHAEPTPSTAILEAPVWDETLQAQLAASLEATAARDVIPRLDAVVAYKGASVPPDTLEEAIRAATGWCDSAVSAYYWPQFVATNYADVALGMETVISHQRALEGAGVSAERLHVRDESAV